MDKQNVAYNGIYYFAIKINEVLIMCCNMDKPWKHYAQWHKKKKVYDSTYIEISRIDKFIETASRLEEIRSWDEWGMGVID